MPKLLTALSLFLFSLSASASPAPTPAEKQEMQHAATQSAFLFAVTQATIDSCTGIDPAQAQQFAKILKNFEINTVTKLLGPAAATQYRADFSKNYSRMMAEFPKAKPADIEFLCAQTKQQLPAILQDLSSPATSQAASSQAASSPPQPRLPSSKSNLP